MPAADVRLLLWLLKLGAPLNLWFLLLSFETPAAQLSPAILLPARILFFVSAWRCLFPNRYEGNIVLHRTPLSSALMTRILATFAEVAWIGQFAWLLHLFNTGHLGWINAVAVFMVVQVIASQGFVWAALLTGRRSLYVFEELGWFLIFVGNTAASLALRVTADPSDGAALLLNLNLIFGAFYLPWQVLHLRALRANAQATNAPPEGDAAAPGNRLARLWRDMTPSTRATDWGGTIGIVWMTAYWALLIPPWIFVVISTLGRH